MQKQDLKHALTKQSNHLSKQACDNNVKTCGQQKPAEENSPSTPKSKVHSDLPVYLL